jgi:hypothetical protein
MPTALLISTALATSIFLPISASAKEHRSASVKREFQLTHPCPATGHPTLLWVLGSVYSYARLFRRLGQGRRCRELATEPKLLRQG